MLFTKKPANRETQAAIPAKLDKRDPQLQRYCKVLEEKVKFDPSRISQDSYDEYMAFVESVWNHSSRGLVPHRFNMDNALEILHKSKYSLPRAKFWVQFPLLYRLEMETDPEEGSLLLTRNAVQAQEDLRAWRRRLEGVPRRLLRRPQAQQVTGRNQVARERQESDRRIREERQRHQAAAERRSAGEVHDA